MSAVSPERPAADLFEQQTDPHRKGWCPGALRPMSARDGWLVRLRLTGGSLPANIAISLARLATRFGNGRLDLSARGNLQLRGVRDDGWAPLVSRLQELALIDEHAEAEAARNVLASPLAGCHDGLDIRQTVQDLEAALKSDARLWRLPTKFLFLVDDGSEPSLGGVPADIRFDFRPDCGMFAIGLGGTRETAIRAGLCAMADLVPQARRFALTAIELFARHPDLRRMASLAASLGAAGLADAMGCIPAAPLPPKPSSALVGPRRFHGRDVVGLAIPFGRLNAGMLRLAAQTAADEMRLTPWRTILLPGVSVEGRMLERLRAQGFILDNNDPRLRVEACSGQSGCANATTDTQADAAAVADLATGGRTIHVSGCTKGCAHPAPAAVTLVGRDGRYDVVLAGRPKDRPAARGLDLTTVRTLLETA